MNISGNRCQLGARAMRGARRRGVALLEFALVVPVLLAMALGIIDFGKLERETLVISNATREGARAAALGQSTPTIRARILSAARPPLEADAAGNISNGSITLEHAPRPAGTQPLVYQPWPSDVGSGATQRNGVVGGNLVRVTVAYQHRSITGLFNRSVSIPVVMRREG